MFRFVCLSSETIQAPTKAKEPKRNAIPRTGFFTSNLVSEAEWRKIDHFLKEQDEKEGTFLDSYFQHEKLQLRAVYQDKAELKLMAESLGVVQVGSIDLIQFILNQYEEDEN